MLGRVEIRSSEADWRPLRPGDALCTGDTVRAHERTGAALRLENEVLLRLDQNSMLTLGEAEPDKPSVMELLRGWLHVITRHRKQFRVTTPIVNAVVEGTEFTVAAQPNRSSVTVHEGRVQMQSPGGVLALESGQTGQVLDGGPPQLFPLVRPLDAVQWALYFPPVLRPRPGLDPAAVEASQLLSVGRVDEAAPILKALSARGDTDAQALEAIVLLVLGDRAAARERIQEALKGPPSVAALLASSYVQQSEFRLEDALASAERAAQLEPNNALAIARLAELQLSTGDFRSALRS